MDVLLPKAGSYVVAVSGGVDSVSLLHILQQQPGLKLTVAHFDHGIRTDSADDRRFVEQLADDYGLPFVYDEGNLGAGASEAEARTARYAFLRQTQIANGEQAIVTAHHRDDVLETAIINMLRGSGRKGLTALDNRTGVLRPLLHVLKQDLVNYAQAHNLVWREDVTNQDTSYLRNYVRQRLLSRFSEADREELWQLVLKLKTTNHKLDALLAKLFENQSVKDQLDRAWFNTLPHNAAREVMAAWLRQQGVRNFDSQTLERLVIAAKTAAPGKLFPVRAERKLQVQVNHLALSGAER